VSASCANWENPNKSLRQRDREFIMFLGSFVVECARSNILTLICTVVYVKLDISVPTSARRNCRKCVLMDQRAGGLAGIVIQERKVT
jgi:hypothetical protein